MEENTNKVNEEKQKKEFLKRTEIRTMAKDITKLRKIETEKEKQRIMGLRPKEQDKKPVLAPTADINKETLIPKPLSKKSFPFKKLLPRAIVVLIIICALGLIFWLIGAKKAPDEKPFVPEITQPDEEEIEEKIPEKIPEIHIPACLILTEQTEILEISETQDIVQVFSQIMEQELPNDALIRVVIKNISQGRLVSLQELSSVFQIEISSEIFQKFGPDYSLIIYGQEQGKRIAFIANIKEKQGLTESLDKWEQELKEFKPAKYKGIAFRYLTISEQDHIGICYSFIDDLFIWTSSGELMVKIIDKLSD